MQLQMKRYDKELDTYLRGKLSSAATDTRKVFYQKLIDANDKRIDGPAAGKPALAADGKARERGGSGKNTARDEQEDDVLGFPSFD